MLFAIGDLLLVFANEPLVLVGAVIAGASIPWLLVAFYTLMQRETPQQLIGRVATSAEVLLGGPQTLSIGLGAVFVAIVDYRILLAVMGTLVFGCGIFLVLRRDRPQPVSAAAAVRASSP
ncbi:MAG: hypothetical protein GEV07_09110 [Streptosporangiales bacterium]|nr:hypothetical protein [Streptosporangiales bacterium]